MFGTVLNRFVIQAVIGHPLTVYGPGSQTRGIIDIRDTVRCIELACENPANRGEFRVLQPDDRGACPSRRSRAGTVAGAYPAEVTIEHLDNPRVERPGSLLQRQAHPAGRLGLQPHLLSDTLIEVDVQHR